MGRGAALLRHEESGDRLRLGVGCQLHEHFQESRLWMTPAKLWSDCRASSPSEGEARRRGLRAEGARSLLRACSPHQAACPSGSRREAAPGDPVAHARRRRLVLEMIGVEVIVPAAALARALSSGRRPSR